MSFGLTYIENITLPEIDVEDMNETTPKQLQKDVLQSLGSEILLGI